MIAQQNIFTKREDKPLFTREGVQIVKQDPFQRGYTYLDTSDNTLRLTPVGAEDDDFSIVRLSTVGGLPLLSKQVSKFAVYEVGLNIENNQINIRNNVVQFYSSNDGALNGAGNFINPSVLHTGTIVPGNYAGASDLSDALILAMNAALPAHGLVFTDAAFTNPDGNASFVNFNISSAGGSFAWSLGGDPTDVGFPMDQSQITNSALIRGRHLYNLSRSQNATVIKKIGMVLGFYSRYLDLVSTS